MVKISVALSSMAVRETINYSNMNPQALVRKIPELPKGRTWVRKTN